MSNKEEFTFDKLADIPIFVGIGNRSNLEAIVVTQSGKVFLYDLGDGDETEIGQVTFDANQLQLQIHNFCDFVGVTQKNGTFGTVLSLTDCKYAKALERGEYCAYASQFPIAFYAKDEKTFLIHGTEWNRLDITCLESDDLLTDRIIDDENDLNSFDYFHSSLSVSPDSTSFISNGWHWHPFGRVTHYSIDRFLSDYEAAHFDILLTDDADPEDAYLEADWDRPHCWIARDKIAFGCNRGSGYYGEKIFQSEILIYDLKSKAITRIPFDGFRVTDEGDVAGSLYFDSERNRLIGLNSKTGLLITELDGIVILKNESLAGFDYNVRHSVFFRWDEDGRKLELIRINN